MISGIFFLYSIKNFNLAYKLQECNMKIHKEALQMKHNYTLFYGGPIITMGEKEKVEAVVVRDDKILYAGDYETCMQRLANKNVEKINLNGKCLLPGFINPHAHLMMLGMCYTWIDLSYPNVKCIDDIVDKLKTHSTNLKDGGIIRGFGFDQRTLKEKRYPTADDLDRVS